MKIGQDPFNPDITPQSQYHGYVVDRIAELPETAALFYQLEDPSTGTRHVHISCEDRENTFGVASLSLSSSATTADGRLRPSANTRAAIDIIPRDFLNVIWDFPFVMCGSSTPPP